MTAISRPNMNHDQPNQFEIIALVEDGLRAQQYHGKEHKAAPVKPGDAATESAAIKQCARDAGDDEGINDIGVKKITPAEMLVDPAAERNADRERHEREHTPNAQAQQSLPLWISSSSRASPTGSGRRPRSPEGCAPAGITTRFR